MLGPGGRTKILRGGDFVVKKGALQTSPEAPVPRRQTLEHSSALNDSRVRGFLDFSFFFFFIAQLLYFKWTKN